MIVTVIADADVTDAGDAAGEVVVLLIPQALTDNKVTIATTAARKWQEIHGGAANESTWAGVCGVGSRAK